MTKVRIVTLGQLVGFTLRLRREELGLTRSDVVKHIGLKADQLPLEPDEWSQIENGEGALTAISLLDVCRLMDWSLGEYGKALEDLKQTVKALGFAVVDFTNLPKSSYDDVVSSIATVKV